jgi:hypothetical protein
MKQRSFGGLGAIIASGAAALAPGVAHAAEPGFYVAGYYGEAKIGGADKAVFDDFAIFAYDAYGFIPDPGGMTSSLGDDRDASFGMSAGYRLFRWLALEGGYADLGEIVYRNDSVGTQFGNPEQWFQKQAVSVSGITLSALGILPVSYRWELYARAGLLFATNEIDLYITDRVGADNVQFSDSSTEMLAGVGASFSFAEVYAARFEFQRIFDAGENLVEGDLDILSIGFTVSF